MTLEWYGRGLDWCLSQLKEVAGWSMVRATSREIEAVRVMADVNLMKKRKRCVVLKSCQVGVGYEVEWRGRDNKHQ